MDSNATEATYREGSIFEIADALRVQLSCPPCPNERAVRALLAIIDRTLESVTTLPRPSGRALKTPIDAYEACQGEIQSVIEKVWSA